MKLRFMNLHQFKIKKVVIERFSFIQPNIKDTQQKIFLDYIDSDITSKKSLFRFHVTILLRLQCHDIKSPDNFIRANFNVTLLQLLKSWLLLFMHMVRQYLFSVFSNKQEVIATALCFFSGKFVSTWLRVLETIFERGQCKSLSSDGRL